MNHGFWSQLKKPFFALAPMADVTDAAFRQIIVKYGKPDVLWTEFVSADGLAHPIGREKLMRDLSYIEGERPIVAQLFSSNPENMKSAAKLCAELGFDGIDINMGCPDRTIEKQGCGAAMIRTPDIAATIIQAAKDGIAESGKSIPVSVKTRIGYGSNEMETWLPFLLRQNIAVLTVHLRTRKELSNVPAHWEYMERIVEIRNDISPETLILGNGDVVDMNDARKKVTETGCDGIMIGRAIFGNPFLFSDREKKSPEQPIFRWRVEGRDLVQSFLFRIGIIKKNKYWLRHTATIPLAQKLEVMIEHASLFEELLGDIKNFAIMKKHFKAYANGFPGAKELRIKLMDTSCTADVRTVVDEFLTGRQKTGNV